MGIDAHDAEPPCLVVGGRQPKEVYPTFWQDVSVHPGEEYTYLGGWE